MRTYRCCTCCRVRSHLVYKLGSTFRDDHPDPCAKCEPGRELVADTTKLPQMRAT